MALVQSLGIIQAVPLRALLSTLSSRGSLLSVCMKEKSPQVSVCSLGATFLLSVFLHKYPLLFLHELHNLSQLRKATPFPHSAFFLLCPCSGPVSPHAVSYHRHGLAVHLHFASPRAHHSTQPVV